MDKPYIITYDLNNPGQKYSDVKKLIEGFSKAYIKLQESVWLIRSEYTPDEMTDNLHQVFDGNDELFICELVNNYSGLASKENWKFIRENIFNTDS
ncbi:hypothetical protein OZX58_03115 [Lactobacillus sp. ESL0680]|uniref:hypothetical protein n=1 Tax=Lactobacillus sp. ESL0680 TaxID=2983210 RepID=UPI0023F6E1D0|nr:hypothetical protein [Lactobacillus sp. ESL0680]WEV39241.1 hypothetical protein OZX58_03115 [Lactobacillus sp. ESL0680]